MQKNVWNAAHEIAKNSKIFKKSTPGKEKLHFLSNSLQLQSLLYLLI